MIFLFKLLIGRILFKIGYLAELVTVYHPSRKVYFGITKQWKRQQRGREKLRKLLNQKAT